EQRATLILHSFPTRRSSDLHQIVVAARAAQRWIFRSKQLYGLQARFRSPAKSRLDQYPAGSLGYRQRKLRAHYVACFVYQTAVRGGAAVLVQPEFAGVVERQARTPQW